MRASGFWGEKVRADSLDGADTYAAMCRLMWLMGVWGVECTLAVIGTGGPVKSSNIMWLMGVMGADDDVGSKVHRRCAPRGGIANVLVRDGGAPQRAVRRDVAPAVAQACRQVWRPLCNNITSFYGPPCANNGKDALNTPETLLAPSTHK
eukprot:2694947-Pyramimonas_sp.AAC.4